MKNKIAALILALALLSSLCGCSSEAPLSPAPPATPADVPENAAGEAEQPEAKDFPIVGTWQAENDDTKFIRVQEDGTMTVELVSVFTSTHTSNGVSSTSTSKSVQTFNSTWEMKKKTFSYTGVFLNQGVMSYKAAADDGIYRLVGDTDSYVRVGNADYDILGGSETEVKDLAAEATEYVLGQPITAEGIEMTFTEGGFADDIRVTSRESGLTITSGPPAESGKQFFYLKGTLRNTAKSEIRPAIGGKVTIDGYEYELKTDTVKTNANPVSSIEPLESVILMLYVQVPDELATGFTEGNMVFGFNDNFDIVDITNSDYLYVVNANDLP